MLWYAALWVLALSACTRGGRDEAVGEEQRLYEQARTYLFPLPATDSLRDTAMERLGARLYEEKALSLDSTVSCATCHPVAHYGVDGKPVSEGIMGRRGTRNAPTTFFSGYYLAQFWDGRAKDLEHQVTGPLTNPNEMGLPDTNRAVSRLRRSVSYRRHFLRVFGDSVVTYSRLANAIAAYERSLVTETRLDAYLRGDLDALGPDEKAGLRIMLDKGCIPCHSGTAMGGALYQKFGIFDDYRRQLGHVVQDSGRMAVTGLEQDRDVYKVPSLRNIVHTAPYFHDGSVSRLEDAIRIMGRLQVGMELSGKEVRLIRRFLEAASVPSDSLSVDENGRLLRDRGALGG